MVVLDQSCYRLWSGGRFGHRLLAWSRISMPSAEPARVRVNVPCRPCNRSVAEAATAPHASRLAGLARRRVSAAYAKNRSSNSVCVSQAGYGSPSRYPLATL